MTYGEGRRTVADNCRFEGCQNEPERNDLCAGHRKQLQRDGELKPLNMTARERLEQLRARADNLLDRMAELRESLHGEMVERGLAYRNADSEDDKAYRALYREYLEAAEAWTLFRLRSKRALRVSPRRPKLDPV